MIVAVISDCRVILKWDIALNNVKSNQISQLS